MTWKDVVVVEYSRSLFLVVSIVVKIDCIKLVNFVAHNCVNVRNRN